MAGTFVMKHQIKFEHISHKVNRFLGTSQALLVGLVVMVVWAVSFLFGGKWHELICELVAMVSFLNLFTLQRAQNKDLKAIHIKLDELIASSSSATNHLIKAEEAPEHVLDQVHELYKSAATAAINDPSRSSMNIGEVEEVMDNLRRDIAEAEVLESKIAAEANIQSS
jgi:low affinity Fe/Cu permease